MLGDRLTWGLVLTLAGAALAACTRQPRPLRSVATTLPGMVLPASCAVGDARAAPHSPCGAPYLLPGTLRSQEAVYGLPVILRFAQEPSLFDLAERDVEVYRVVWDRSFHPGMVVRVELSPNGQFVVAKEVRGRTGDPSRFVGSVSRALSVAEWSVVARAIEDSAFWTTSTECTEDSAGGSHGCLGFDGAEWTLEGARGNTHHIVDRWSPKSGAFREACLTILRLSGLELEPIY